MLKFGMLMTTDLAEKVHNDRKTQTRRLINPQPPSGISGVTEVVEDGKRTWCFERQLPDGEWDFWHAKPRYWPHDIVAIKETHWRLGRWRKSLDRYSERRSMRFEPGLVDGEYSLTFVEPESKPTDRTKTAYHKISALFLPFDDARTHVEILDVRPEQLQEITEADAIAEGVTCGRWGEPTHRKCFELLWDSINGKKAPWDSNPFVWRYKLKRVDKP